MKNMKLSTHAINIIYLLDKGVYFNNFIHFLAKLNDPI